MLNNESSRVSLILYGQKFRYLARFNRTAKIEILLYIDGVEFVQIIHIYMKYKQNKNVLRLIILNDLEKKIMIKSIV